MRRIVIIVLVAFVLIFLAFTATSIIERHSKVSAGQKVADSFIGYVLTNNPSASYKFFTKSAQQVTPEGNWQGEVQKLSLFFGGNTPSYLASNFTSASDVVTYSIKGQSENYKFSVFLIKLAGNWQVQSFSSQLKTS